MLADNFKECTRCHQNFPPLSLFLCKGQMVCEGCYMVATDGNTKFINEDDYRRK